MRCCPLSSANAPKETRRARPPKVLACSNSVTGTPAAASVTAAAHPAQPPPTTATRDSPAELRAASATACGVPCDPELAQRRERDPAIEYAISVALDLFEKRPIDRRHDDSRPLRCAVLGRKRVECPRIPGACARDLLLHQRGQRLGRFAFEYRGCRDAVRGELLLWEVDPAASRVFADVADDVGQLEGDAEVACVLTCGRVHVAEYLGRHQPDDAGDAMAVALELGEVEIAAALEVHRHAVDHRLEMLLGKMVLSDDRPQRERDRV